MIVKIYRDLAIMRRKEVGEHDHLSVGVDLEKRFRNLKIKFKMATFTLVVSKSATAVTSELQFDH